MLRMMKTFLFVLLLLRTIISNGQPGPAQLQEVLNAPSTIRNLGLQFPKQIARLYWQVGYQLLWTSEGNENVREKFFSYLSNAADFGLDEKEYQYEHIQLLRKGPAILKTCHDSIFSDLRISDAALHFLNDIKYGKTAPSLAYKGISYKPDQDLLIDTLAFYLLKNDLDGLLLSVESTSARYAALKNWLSHLNKVTKENGFHEVRITSNLVALSNNELKIKLYQLGFLDTNNASLTNKALTQKLQLAQKAMNLLNDGQLRKPTLVVLNIPIQTRIEELRSAINTIRWIEALASANSLIVVNIPAANLLYFQDGIPKLESRVIVGKPSTPTPTLSSKISDVVLYPYWYVPAKIAVNELLPQIKRNTGYLDANSFQVLNTKGEIVDPYAINWHELSSAYFPFTIRQSTGCENSLGIVKLNFYNPFHVYLHDTPGKGLFFLNKRYFSHGCMRVEMALDLARILLKDKAALVDSIETLGCLYDQPPIVLPISGLVNVVVLYQTAWINKEGRVSFFEDVYKKRK